MLFTNTTALLIITGLRNLTVGLFNSFIKLALAFNEESKEGNTIFAIIR